jgi:hypothetical protein
VTPRTVEQRTVDVMVKLSASDADVWVASASTSGSGSGAAHLVPLSLAWDGACIVVALAPTSVTARNIIGSGQARCAVGSTRDVVMVDVTLEQAVGVADASPELADAYATQADWDPRASGGEFSFLVLRPVRIQAWRDEEEIADRTVMRDGTWLI